MGVTGVEPLRAIFGGIARDISVNATVPVGPGLFDLWGGGLREVMGTFHPWRTILDIVIAGQKDMAVALPLVELVQVAQGRMLRLGLNGSIV